MPVRPRVRPARRRAGTPLIFHCMYRPKEVDNGSPIEARATIVTDRCGELRRGRHWFQNSNYPRPRAAPVPASMKWAACLIGITITITITIMILTIDDILRAPGEGTGTTNRSVGNANGGANRGSRYFKLPPCRCSVKLASLCFINSCRA